MDLCWVAEEALRVRDRKQENDADMVKTQAEAVVQAIPIRGTPADPGLPRVTSPRDEALEPRRMKRYLRLLLSIGGAISGGVLAALLVVILDLYLTGRSYASLSRMYVGPSSLVLSISDVIFLATILVSGLVTWFILRVVVKAG